MLFLSFVWLLILIVELVNGSSRVLSNTGTTLWFLFVIYFLIRFITAINQFVFLKKNWLFIIAILVSVLRFFPDLQRFILVRGLTATIGMQVIWIFVSAAAGLLHFENLSGDLNRLQSYPNAVWWTAMQMTNIGSSYSVKSICRRKNYLFRCLYLFSRNVWLSNCFICSINY